LVSISISIVHGRIRRWRRVVWRRRRWIRISRVVLRRIVWMIGWRRRIVRR